MDSFFGSAPLARAMFRSPHAPFDVLVTHWRRNARVCVCVQCCVAVLS